MLNNPSCFYYCWHCPYISSLPICPRSHCPTCSHQARTGVHSHTRAHSHAHLPMSLTRVSQLRRPSSSCGSNPRALPLPSPPPHWLSSSQLPSLPLPHSFLLTDKPPLAHPRFPPPSTHRHICFCSHLPLYLNSLAFQCTHTRSLTHRHVLYPVNLHLDHKTCAHTPERSQGTPRYLSCPSLPVRSRHYPPLPRHTALGRPLPGPRSDPPPHSPAGLYPPGCFPSSSLSSPAPPSSQNSPCRCRHRHLHCCHC